MPLKICIVTPVLNCQSLVKAYCDLIRPYLDTIKLIFVDGGSVDLTTDIILDFVKGNSSVECLIKPGLGIYESMNYAATLVDDECFLMYLGVDDGLASGCLVRELLSSSHFNHYDALFFDVLEKRTRIGHEAVYVNKPKCVNIDFSAPFSARNFLVPPFQHQGFIVKAKVARKVGIDSALGIHADYASMIMIFNGFRVAHVPKAFTFYSLGGKSDYFSWINLLSFLKIARACRINVLLCIFLTPLAASKIFVKLFLPPALLLRARALMRLSKLA